MPALKIWNGTSWDIVSGPAGATGPAGGAGPAGGTFALVIGGNTAGATASVSSGTLSLAGGNNITLSQNANTITISAANQTFATRSFLYSSFGQATVTGAYSGVMTCQPLPVQWHVTCTEFDWLMSLTSQSTGTCTVSASVGIYSWVNTTSLGLASSGSVSYSWGSASSTWYNSLRQWSCPLNAYMTPGDYVAAVWLRTSGTVTFAMMGESTISFAGSAGVATATSAREVPGLGVYSVSFSTAMPANIVAANLAGQALSARMNDLVFRALGA